MRNVRQRRKRKRPSISERPSSPRRWPSARFPLRMWVEAQASFSTISVPLPARPRLLERLMKHFAGPEGLGSVRMPRSCTRVCRVAWKYDPGERRRKHKWHNDYAGFEVEGGVEVGTCSTTITQELAEQLLNTGVEWNNPNMPSSCPRNIYNVHEGVVYKAAITLADCPTMAFPARDRFREKLSLS
jgi:hypothetical protein